VIFSKESSMSMPQASSSTKTLLRLSGAHEQPSAYLLSQAMGGGKTHSMIVLGLLARYPHLRLHV
jgi:hypothetical protein